MRKYHHFLVDKETEAQRREVTPKFELLGYLFELLNFRY